MQKPAQAFATMKILLVFAGLLLQPSDSANLRKPHGGLLAVQSYTQDCGLSSPISLAAAKVSVGAKIPGAGMEPDSIKPFDKVLKDSFFPVDCVADFMFTHGDKFGDNKNEYLLAGVTNTSIVHYAAHVAKEDREEMTHQVCFSFCRTVPDMHYFGIKNGRDCYCMAFYKPMADDSSVCDAVCDGEPTTFCGGKSKSSIFGMHSCDNTAEQLSSANGKVSELYSEMVGLEEVVTNTSKGLLSAAEAWQALLGPAGDVGASNLMQTAKEFARDLGHAAGASSKLSKTVGSLKTSAAGMKGADLTDSKTMGEAEELIAKIEEASTQSAAAVEELQQLEGKAIPNAKGVENASQTYYSLMYFVDKEFESVPSTCTGTAAEKPMLGTMDSCARACDADVHECVGFSYFPVVDEVKDIPEGAGLCFLMSKFKTVKYWTGCNGEEAEVESAELDEGEEDIQEIQAEDLPWRPRWLSLLHLRTATRKVDAKAVKCVAKLSEFEGTTLKPNPSGKCDLCLKEADKADRCFK